MLLKKKCKRIRIRTFILIPLFLLLQHRLLYPAVVVCQYLFYCGNRLRILIERSPKAIGVGRHVFPEKPCQYGRLRLGQGAVLKP